MAQQAFLLKVIGIPHIPSIIQINARPDAGTNSNIVFKVDVGTTNVRILEAKEDIEKRDLEGKVYQWFKVEFPQGTAWVRDDLVEVWGDGQAYGYPVLTTPQVAFQLVRQTAIPQGAETQSFQQNQEPAALPPSASTEVSTSTPTTSSEVSTSTPTTSSEVSSAPVATTPTTAPAMATAMSSFPAKLRPGPGTGHNPPVTSMQYRDTAEILETKMGDDGKPLYWVKVNYRGQIGWTREDLVRLSGNFTPFGLNASDKYPNPAQESTWVRGWDTTGSIWNTGKHDGWDHSGTKGKPLLAGPQGGIVFQKMLCTKCGAQGASTLERGYTLYDQRIYSDQGWNFGYGHYIIIGYENSKLPASTQAYLASEGRAGHHIFVMYAHCQDLLAEAGQTVAPNQQIASLGNSGNSSGAHLHLEVRISATMQPRAWWAIKDGLRSPGILFLR